VDNRAEIRDFLATRRAKITPGQVGLPEGGRRRVPGLRREEVAVLAGVSPEWYTRLEKGHIAGVSDEVLEAVARALQLDEAEQRHLFDLSLAARPHRPQRRRSKPYLVRPSIQRLVESMSGTPAFVRNGRLDILAINQLGRALYQPVFDDPARPANLARFAFLDPRARTFYPGWDSLADGTVAVLRTEAGRNPHNRALTDLVGELATTSSDFRIRWAAHDVRLHQTGTKYFRHPIVGLIDVAFDSLDLPADPGLTLTAYSAEPGTPSADALSLLASWAATHDPDEETRQHTVADSAGREDNATAQPNEHTL
jgi:transcriptional regulator with XRE-family HTH domain